MNARERDVLGSSGRPTFFEIDHSGQLDVDRPAGRQGQTVRVLARSLGGMQKEAIVLPAYAATAWRLASDEGPYLAGCDAAPCPLAFMTTGMVASYANEILALARQRSIAVRDLVLVQDNYYTMAGSALAGTMTGGALPVELSVAIDADGDGGTLHDLVMHAVSLAPVADLLGRRHPSRFTLTFNGRPADAGAVTALDAPVPPDPGSRFAGIEPAGAPGHRLVERMHAVETVHGVAGGAGSSLQATQKRRLHIRGTCRVRADGVKEVVQETRSPLGSTFRFLSDESDRSGGAGRAPDAATYIATGVAFCFMTQLGRYATILGRDLSHYTVVQDVHLPWGGASGGTGRPGAAEPVETHVFLTSAEDEAFARRCLEMGEQTCFLHALCRTELTTQVVVRGR